jgi:hypothetical protein
MKLLLDGRRDELLSNMDHAHVKYYHAGVFGGPSLYFHLQALEAGKSGNIHRFAETVYAVLAAWGMHRMGSGGSKMCKFEKFEQSLIPLWPIILRLQQVLPKNLDVQGWRDLKKVFCGICCMDSKTILVGNSKVMAHALPNLVPPIDRHYTLRFLYKNETIINGTEWEWERLQAILQGFFYPVVESELFISQSKEWNDKQYLWDTSPLKIVDNLIIGWTAKGKESSPGTSP